LGNSGAKGIFRQKPPNFLSYFTKLFTKQFVFFNKNVCKSGQIILMLPNSNPKHALGLN